MGKNEKKRLRRAAVRQRTFKSGMLLNFNNQIENYRLRPMTPAIYEFGTLLVATRS